MAQDAAPQEEALAQGETPAQAEAAAAQGQAAAEVTSDGSTDIIVYARKRAENVQSVPIAISVLPKDIIDDGNLDELTDFVDLVPNATFSEDAVTSSEISIRGSGRNMSEEDPSVGTYRDGVYIGGLVFSTANFYDIAQVEILRGPQAGLYGRNAVGGAISVTSERPRNTFGGYVNAQYGSKQRLELRGALNAPVIQDKWALRVAGLLINQNKGFDRIVNHDQYVDAVETKSIRLRSLATPTDNLELLTTFEYLDVDGGGGLLVPAPNAANDFLDTNQMFPIPGTSPDETDEQLRNLPNFKKFDQVQAIQQIDWTTGAGTLTGIASYRSSNFKQRRDEDASEFDVQERANDAGQDSFFAEARFASRDFNGFKFVAGLSHLNEDVKLNYTYRIGGLFAGQLGGASIADLYAAGVVTPEWAPIFSSFAGVPIPVGTPISAFGLTPFATGWGGYLGDTFPAEFVNEQKLESTAVFVEANYQVTDAVEIWGNLRYTRDKKSIVFSQTHGNPSLCPVACPEIFALFFNGLVAEFGGQGSDTFKRLSPGAGVNWQVSDDALIYGKVVTGFKAGGFNDTSGLVENLPFDEETTISYEVGAKTKWFDRRLTLNAAAFVQKRKDALVQVIDPAMPISTIGINAGEISSKGLEVELSARPASRLQLQAAFGYLDSEFEKFAFNGLDFAGNKVPRSFKYTLSAIATYTHPVSDTLDLFGYASYRNAWDGYTDNDNIERMSNPEVVDIRLGLKGEKWKLVGYVDNLFDNRYTSIEFRPVLPPGSHQGIFAPGRTVGLQAELNF